MPEIRYLSERRYADQAWYVIDRAHELPRVIERVAQFDTAHRIAEYSHHFDVLAPVTRV